jgi:hypothetical protein
VSRDHSGVSRDHSGAARTPLSWYCSIATRAIPTLFASFTIAVSIACAAVDRPFGSATAIPTVLNVPGTTLEPGRAVSHGVDDFAVRREDVGFTAAQQLDAVRYTTRHAHELGDFNVRVSNKSSGPFCATPILTPVRSTWAASVNSRLGAAR